MEHHEIQSTLSQVLIEVWVTFSPYLLFGSLIAGALHVLLPQGFVQRHLSEKGGVWKAVMLGVPLPLCSCGVIPAGLGLRRDGASPGATVGFLISTPQTGVDSMMVSGAFLGWPFAIAKVFAALFTGIMGGLISDRVAPPDKDLPSLNNSTNTHQEDRGAPWYTRLLNHSLSILEPIWGWVVFGVVASALINVYLPQSTLEGVSAYGTAAALGLTLTFSLPLYVCATASVPLAAALVMKGFPVGAALVFLMAGPATNVATIGAVYRGLGGRLLTVYLGTLICGSILFALLLEPWLLPSAQSAIQHTHEEAGLFSIINAIICALLFIGFAVNNGIQKFKSIKSLKIDHHLEVEGITCGGCVRKIERILGEADGVEEVIVKRAPDEVMIRGSLKMEEVCQLIIKAGFIPKTPQSPIPKSPQSSPLSQDT